VLVLAIYLKFEYIHYLFSSDNRFVGSRLNRIAQI